MLKATLRAVGIVTLCLTNAIPVACSDFLPLAEDRAMSRQTATSDPRIATLFKNLARGASWTLTDDIHLNFQTFHPQGLAITPKHLFLSSVEVIEPTVKYPTPRNGLDRTPGKGVGHVFVMNHKGELKHEIRLHEGHKYHAGGIDYDGTYIWVPLAEYRPNSSASIYRVDANTLEVHKQFDADDHYGGIVLDKTTNHLVGNNWGSRNFTTWDRKGNVLHSWANPDFFIDYQDCQYVHPGKAICGGVASLPQDPAALSAIGATGGNVSSTVYELGGIDLVDLHSHSVEHAIPISIWSPVGHAITRNPVKLTVKDDKLVMWVAPDDGIEIGGTHLLTYTSS